MLVRGLLRSCGIRPPGTRCLTDGSWLLVHGLLRSCGIRPPATRCLTDGSWFLVLGSWFLPSVSFDSPPLLVVPASHGRRSRAATHSKQHQEPRTATRVDPLPIPHRAPSPQRRHEPATKNQEPPLESAPCRFRTALHHRNTVTNQQPRTKNRHSSRPLADSAPCSITATPSRTSNQEPRTATRVDPLPIPHRAPSPQRRHEPATKNQEPPLESTPCRFRTALHHRNAVTNQQPATNL